MKAKTIILAFLPWILLKVITLHHSLLALKIAIAAGFVVSIILAIAGIHKGVIVIGGLLFFSFGTATIIFMDNPWVIKYTAPLAHGTLAFFSWLSILIKRPFTTAYTREGMERKYWNSPQFVLGNYVVTGTWASVFTANMILSIMEMGHKGTPVWICETTQIVFIALGILITLYYPKHWKRD